MAVSLSGAPIVISGEHTPPGTGEVTVPVKWNDDGPFSAIELAAGKSLVVGRMIVSAETATEFRLERSSDGATYVPVATPVLAGPGTLEISPAILFSGPCYIRVRARNHTSAGKVLVTAYGTEINLN